MLNVNRKTIFSIWMIGVLLLAASQGPAHAQAPSQKITFDDHIKSLLNRRCSACHNSNRREGDLDVTTYVNLMQGGGSGAVLDSEDVANSYLYALVTHEDSPEMPPSGNKIPASEIKLIADWIDGGLLETVGSKAAKAKPKVNMTLTGVPTARPKNVPMPLRMSLQPVITSQVGSVSAMASSPWSPVLAVSTPKQILLYRTDSLQLAGVLENLSGVARSMMFSRNGQFLIAGGGRDGESGTALLFDVRTGELVSKFGSERDVVLAADLSPDQTAVAIGGPSKLVNLLSVADESRQELKRHVGWVTALEYSPNGKLLATADRNGGLLVWEAGSGAFIQKLDGHSKAITSLSWRSDSRFVVSSSEDGSLKIWNPEQAKAVKSFAAHGGGSLVAGYRRDGTIYSAGRDRLVKLWKADGKAIRVFKGLSDIVVAASVCDETDRVFAADWTGKILVWNIGSEKAIKSLPANPPTIQRRLKSANSKLDKAKRHVHSTGESIKSVMAQATALNVTLAKNDAVIGKLKIQITNLSKSSHRVQLQSRRNVAVQWQRIATIKDDRETRLRLKRAFEATGQALEALPDDEVLKKSRAHLARKIDLATSRQDSLLDQVGFWQNENIRLLKLLASVRGELKSAVAKKATRSQRRLKLAKQIADVQDKLDKQKLANEAARKEQIRWQQEVVRWTNEQQFIQTFSQLRSQQATAQQKVAEHASVVQSAEAALREAAKVLERARKSAAQKEANVKTIEGKIEKLRRPTKPVVSPGPVAGRKVKFGDAS